jgi:hypothetical protein
LDITLDTVNWKQSKPFMMYDELIVTTALLSIFTFVMAPREHPFAAGHPTFD